MTPNYVPDDLLINILSRLSVKSLSRFCCVSKLWSSIITSRYFRNQHLSFASSSPPPRLLIVFNNYGEQVVISAPNPNARSSSSSSSSSSYKVNIRSVYNVVRGNICFGSGHKGVGICNPLTRQVHILPDFKFSYLPVYMLGYDGVEDQYKVLAVDRCFWRRREQEHKVAVVGRGGGWRDVKSCTHETHTLGLNMNGTLYYGASRKDVDYPDNSIIMTFDVRHENFNIIKVPTGVLQMGSKNMWVSSEYYSNNKRLINYGGKVGVVEIPSDHGRSFRLWVVEDAEKEEWSMHTFHLPIYAVGQGLRVMDTFSTGEICLVRNKLHGGPFRLFYCNLEKESMRTVTIEEVDVSKFKKTGTLCLSVSDLYESFMFLENHLKLD